MNSAHRTARIVLVASSCVVGLAMVPAVAWGYVGPGAGLSIVGTILAFVAAVVLGVVGFVWYPLRRLLRAVRAKKTASKQDADA